MERIPLPKNIDPQLSAVLNALMDDSLGDVIQLSADVTTAGAELKVNQVGFNLTSAKLFFNLFGSTYSVQLVLV